MHVGHVPSAPRRQWDQSFFGSMSSSRVQMIASSSPALRQASSICERIVALAMWRQFHVTRYPTPFLTAMAICTVSSAAFSGIAPDSSNWVANLSACSVASKSTVRNRKRIRWLPVPGARGHASAFLGPEGMQVHRPEGGRHCGSDRRDRPQHHERFCSAPIARRSGRRDGDSGTRVGKSWVPACGWLCQRDRSPAPL